MESPHAIMEYVTGPVQLVGLVLVVLAGIVPRLAGRRADRKTRRLIVVGMFGIGALVVLGGIWMTNSEYAGQTAEASGEATAISAGRDVVVGRGSLDPGERDAVPSADDTGAARPSKQSARATGHGVAISAGRDVHRD